MTRTLQKTFESIPSNENAYKTPLESASTVLDSDGMAVLRNVHSDENFSTVEHGSPSWLEALLPEQPSLKAAGAGRTVLPQASPRTTYGLTNELRVPAPAQRSALFA